MSNKSTKTATKKLSVPRSLQEIQTEYQQLMMSAGQLQYQIAVQTKQLEATNARSEVINNEASARMKLDKEAKDAAAATDTKATEEAKA